MNAHVQQYRISCPSSHIISVPATLLDEELICPQCNTRFLAKFKDSLEFAEEQTERAAYQWLVIAISTAVLLLTAGIIAVVSQLRL
ncbi:MAG: hypothetical protein HOD99_05235 [Planctomycetaceae bacterium]|jgi:hypothetical protein|nr:hypothetical protein [Planctomycetaceae bacterium]MBT4158218.1 hypothetical protein [Planctomycetaceae bacterium]MBT4886794.1 hypothetical protein [Planctomycetaceae bacterium]MBT6054079.1 hypothetical protein [Planctomycetaceae bacterium]MBT6642270.1 hypothetical protein [Planctomycetaceae bacterium]